MHSTGDIVVEPGDELRADEAGKQRLQLRHIAEGVDQTLLPAKRQAERWTTASNTA